MSITNQAYCLRFFLPLLLVLASCTNEGDLQAQSVSIDRKATKGFTMAQDLIPFEALKGNIMDVFVHDYNLDGYSDLILAREDGFNLLLHNQGGKDWTLNETVLKAPVNGDSEDIAVADFNGDGVADVFFANEDTYQNELFLSDHKGLGYVEKPLPITGKSNAVLAFDFDLDGDMDLYLGNDGLNGLMLNDGQGNFSAHLDSVLCGTFSTTQDIEWADVNGDGHKDLILANEEDNQLFMRQKDGGFVNQSHLLKNPAKEESREVRAFDFDQDGDLDLFFCNVTFGKGASPSNRILRNTPTGFEVMAAEAHPLNQFNTVDVEFVDLDLDGQMEAILMNAFAGGIQIFSYREGRFEDRSTEFLPSACFYHSGVDLELFDFNGDGVLDLYASGFQGMDLFLLGKND